MAKTLKVEVQAIGGEIVFGISAPILLGEYMRYYLLDSSSVKIFLGRSSPGIDPHRVSVLELARDCLTLFPLRLIVIPCTSSRVNRDATGFVPLIFFLHDLHVLHGDCL